MGNKLNIIKTCIEGLFIIEPNIHKDNRGSFTRVFCEDELKDVLKENTIKQINHSETHEKGSVRGMHFQYPPDSEIKIIKCIRGRVLDIVVDIRKNSKTFLKTFSIELSADNKKMIYISKGFAHGFQTLEEHSELIYLHTSLYTANNEGSLNIKDSLLNIRLPLDIINLSKRDKETAFLDDKFKGIEV